MLEMTVGAIDGCISLMPSELLLTVFSHLVPNIGPIATSNDILVPFTQWDGMDALVAASRVCQQWRDMGTELLSLNADWYEWRGERALALNVDVRGLLHRCWAEMNTSVRGGGTVRLG